MPIPPNPEQYIHEFKLQGLNGRLLRIPGPKSSKREVLFIYGHHSSLERWWGITDLMAKRINVLMPDLPGFGGMDSLYKIGKSASFDNLADWLAELVEKTYQKQKVTIIGMSLGFALVTRMLQRHPQLTKNVDKLVSLFGFASSNDFKLPRHSNLFKGALAKLFSQPVAADIFRYLFLNRFVLHAAYGKTKNAKEKFKGLTLEQTKENMEFEVKLWQANDVRTHMQTAVEFLNFDNTHTKIDLPVYHIAVHNDRYFNNIRVEKHFRQIFSDYYLLAELKSSTHAPTIVRTADEAASLIPKELLETLG